MSKCITIRTRGESRNGCLCAWRQAAPDLIIWHIHPDSSRYKHDTFQERFFVGAIASGGSLAVLDIESGSIIDSCRYYEWNQGGQEISIGHTYLEKAQWGSGTNQEMKELMLKYVFSAASTVWFHVGETHFCSRKAVEKIGATLSHKEERELDGRPYVQLYYKLKASAYCILQARAAAPLRGWTH